MLFYMVNKNDKQIEQVPSSYVLIKIDNKKDNLVHPNVLRSDLTPEFSLSKDKDILKAKYIKRLKNNKLPAVTSLMMSLKKNQHTESIVLIADEDSIEEFGFNYPKILIKFIEKRYGYKGFKFTNTTTIDMRNESKMSDKGMSKYIIDMKGLNDKL